MPWRWSAWGRQWQGPWSHGGGLLPRPYMPSFPPSLSPRSSASSITARVSRCQMGRATFPEPPRGPPLPRPDSGTGRHLGAFPVWLQVPGPAGQECGQGPSCTSGPWGLQAQTGRSWKEAGQLVSGPGFCPGAPEGQHQQVQEPSGVGSSDGVCGLPSTRGYLPGAGRQLTLSHAQTNARCPARPAPPSGSAGAGFPTAAAHGWPWWSPLPPLPRPAGRAGSELPARPVLRSPSVGGPVLRASLSISCPPQGPAALARHPERSRGLSAHPVRG